MIWQPAHPAFDALLRAFYQQTDPVTAPVYVVGGAVRDALLAEVQPQQQRTVDLAKNLTDLDLALAQPAIPTARRVADALGWAFYPLDEARDVARLVFHPSGNPEGEALVCDVARLRGDSIEADLLARDFTINAMAFKLGAPGGGGRHLKSGAPSGGGRHLKSGAPSGGGRASTRSQKGWQVELLDTRGGRQDLADGVVRRASSFSLAEDPLRLLRGVRMMAQLGFAIEAETRTQIERMTSTVRLCSAERVRDELWKMLATPRPDWPLAEMHSLGLLRVVLPEVVELDGVVQSFPHHFDVYRHTLRTVHQAARLREWIRGDWVQPESTWRAIKLMKGSSRASGRPARARRTARGRRRWSPTGCGCGNTLAASSTAGASGWTG